MHRIVYLERDSIIAEVRRPDFPHHWAEHAKTLQSEVKERLAGATIAIVNKLQIDAELIAALPALQMVAVAATGANNIDLEACRVRGIVVSNIRGYAAHTVPEHVLAMLLALSRNIFAYRQAVADGSWQRAEQFCFFDYPIRDLHGATLALIGSGNLGSGVARLAAAFGMRVLRSERKDALSVRPGYTLFAEALRQADAVSLHCPLSAETSKLIGESELRSMKPSALLINTARGGLVDEAPWPGRCRKAGSPAPVSTSSASSHRATATPCSLPSCWRCPTSCSPRTSPGPASRRCRPSPTS
jgi:glycerate dehydrogenase